MDTSVGLANQQKLTLISFVQTLSAVQRTYQVWVPIGMGGKRESKEFVLSARLDDDYVV